VSDIWRVCALGPIPNDQKLKVRVVGVAHEIRNVFDMRVVRKDYAYFRKFIGQVKPDPVKIICPPGDIRLASGSFQMFADRNSSAFVSVGFLSRSEGDGPR